MAKTTANDLFASITDRIIADIEAGAAEWRMPWHRIASVGTPQNVDRRPYRGMNSLWLAMVAADAGYSTGIWGTYRAWQNKGAQVRKGEKGTPVLLWKPTTKIVHDDESGEDKEEGHLFATVYYVFAPEQVDGFEAVVEKLAGKNTEHDTEARLAAADAFFSGYEVDIVEGGNEAFYNRLADEIHVPKFEQFEKAAAFYSTVAHEAVHSTGHGSRLDRQFGKRFGDEAYAAEELVAELGAAFWSAKAGITQAPRPDHASYIAHWLKVLRSDSKALLTVTSKAQAAVDYLSEHTLKPLPEEES